MLKRKSIRPLAIAVLLVFMLSTTVMAATPPNTIFFGDKAYDLSLLNDPELVAEINAAFVSNGNSFVYKNPAGGYIDYNAQPVDPSVIPAGTYKDANKVESKYAAGDKDSDELEVIEISAVDANTISVTFEGIEEAVEIELEEALVVGENQVTFTYNEQEFTETVNYEVEEDGLEVVEVSAIDKTIELNVAVFEPAEDAKANVEIFKLNEDGEKAASATLKATNLDIEEGVVTVDASEKTFGDADYAIVVTVGEEEAEVVETIEFDAVEKLVANINKATAAQLATLLNNDDYFTGFDIAKVDAYYEAKGAVATYKTLAEVQEKVLDAGEAASGFVAFVEEIDETKGVFAKYTLLKETFKFVDDANMDAYMDDSPGTIFDASQKINVAGGVNSFEKVQDEIDQINLDAVVDKFDASVKTIAAATKPSKLQEAKSALEALDLVDAKTKSTVVGTTVNTKTKAEIVDAIDAQLDKIADERDKADKEIVKAQAAIDAFVVANGGAPTAAHTEYDAVVTAIEALDDEDLTETQITTATGTLTAAITALEGKTEELTIIDDTIAALAAFEAAFEVNNATAGNLEAEYIAVTGNFTDFANEDYSYASGKTITTLKADLVTLKAETADWETYNAAIATTSAAEMRTLLFDLQPASEFTNLTPNAAKAEFAQYVIDELAEEVTAPVSFATLSSKIFAATTGYLDVYKAKIAAVNTATDISAMIGALEAISEDYDTLGAEAKADIAGDVFEVKADLKTFADIVAAMGL